MREKTRPYLLISLGFHCCVVLLLFLVEAPRVSQVTPRRVVIKFSDTRERMLTTVPPEQTRLPELEPEQMAESLQMEGPRLLAIPGTKSTAEVPPQRRTPVGGERLTSSRITKPLLPQPILPAAAPALPAELVSRAIESPAPVPVEESGFTEAGALEWRGRERKLLRTAGVAFPDILLEEGLEADVVAVFTVAANGQVIKVDILRSSGYASVDRAVERALRGYLFEPADSANEDVGQIQYRFRLERND